MLVRDIPIDVPIPLGVREGNCCLRTRAACFSPRIKDRSPFTRCFDAILMGAGRVTNAGRRI